MQACGSIVSPVRPMTSHHVDEGTRYLGLQMRLGVCDELADHSYIFTLYI